MTESVVLSLLKTLYGSVVRPQSVLDELLAGHERYGLSRELLDADWITTEPDPPEKALRKELGAGETATIALAAKTNADLCILDDLSARLLAQSMGLSVTGTLGILLAAHQTGQLKDLNAAIGDLQKAGFYLAPDIEAALGKR